MGQDYQFDFYAKNLITKLKQFFKFRIRRRFEAYACAVFKMSALNSNNTFDGLDEPVRPTPGGRKRRLDKENHKKEGSQVTR